MINEEIIVDLSEKGRGRDGEVIALDRRLYMQFLAFGDCTDSNALVDALAQAGIDATLYADANDPRGVGLLLMNEDADFFVGEARTLLTRSPFVELTPKPDYTMFGRTYAIGYESDLDDVLVERPRRRALDPDWPWVIWYPLRRKKGFSVLPDTDQRRMLGEHGNIGKAFGRANQAIDIRLACHGLDKNDNEFVIAILAHELHAASAVVQAMRKTKQTSEYMENMGPFFVGKVIWQSNLTE